MLKIGVSSCFFYPDINRPTFGPKTLCYFERDMARFLARKDVMPILIPDLEEPILSDFLKEMDGFVFQGGSDISPRSYGEEAIQNGRWPGDYYRDQYELKIVDYAFSAKKPILGICRGFQLLNVFFKGTLYQDLPSEVQGPVTHRDAVLYDHISHNVTIEGPHLKKIYGNSPTATVNSVHHQGVKVLGQGLEIESRGEKDGIIEGFSYTQNEAFVLGVQWHPEFSHTLNGQVIDPAPLYEYFLKQIRKDKNT